MNFIVFTGPTLPAREAKRELDALYLPPVAQGDVYRAALRRPRAIGIIDGYFDRVPSVWHKEILWAMAQGVYVFGSASMGALRAAELYDFGMEGVGKIFEAYRDGLIEGDDEVALVHGPAENGYKALSEPMVNIRATLDKAASAGEIGPATRLLLERLAKQLHYRERTYPAILDNAIAAGYGSRDEIERLRRWLQGQKVDQKREDALDMLRVMRECVTAQTPPLTVDYLFEHTQLWDQVVRAAGVLHLDEGEGVDTVHHESLLEELRLRGDEYGALLDKATLRLLALSEARRHDPAVDSQRLRGEIIAFRQSRGLFEPHELEQWMEGNGLNQEQFIQLMRDEAQVRWTKTFLNDLAAQSLPDYLRLNGQYAKILARARDKQGFLEGKGLRHPDLAYAGLTEAELLDWYFSEVLGVEAAEDIEAYSASLGFDNKEAFLRALLREYIYLRREG